MQDVAARRVAAAAQLRRPAPTAASAAPTAGAQGAGDGGGGGGGGELFLGGKVTASSATSITLTGQGQTFTAAITGSTTFTGARGPSGIKVGAEVNLNYNLCIAYHFCDPALTTSLPQRRAPDDVVAATMSCGEWAWADGRHG